MLLGLTIENFALIDRLELSFSPGLNVLTGETGAGKSIILDALDVVLGGKVSLPMVRTGSNRAVIESTFLSPVSMPADQSGSVATWLQQQDIDPLDDDSLICSRELTYHQGALRSRSRVNGIVVNRQQLATLRPLLVEITAQGQTVQLGDPTQQRLWLDQFGGEALIQQRQQVSDLFQLYQAAEQALEQRQKSEHQRLQRLDLLKFQVQELQTLGLEDPDELNQLTLEAQKLSHSVELQQQSYQVYQTLYADDRGERAASDLLGKTATSLQNMLVYDPQLQPILDLVNEALAQVEEAGRQISTYGEAIETDPQRLQEIEDRILDLKQACRKYGPTLAEVVGYWQQIQTELQSLTDASQSLEELEQNYQECFTALQAACVSLTSLRQQAAALLEAKLLPELKPLAMEKVRFQVVLTAVAPTSTGADRITFLFSPNPGEPLQPLAAVASGGEMSRFLLALKTCFSHADGVGTLVFDEIDVGVSGRVTQAIAQKLHLLSRQQQVLCVTHQPIVAAMADAHFQVSKQVVELTGETPADATPADVEEQDDQQSLRTVVRVMQLDADEQRHELAQLAGGHSAQETIAFAESLLTQAADLKQQPSLTPSGPQAAKPIKSAKIVKTAKRLKKGADR